KSALSVLPKDSFVSLKVRVKNIFGIVKKHIDSGNPHMKFSHIARDKEEILASFVPILHLSHQEKLYLRQENHFDEIHITLSEHEDEKQGMIDELGLYEETIEQ
ncbi:MAG: hypothetical protein IH845_02550, partial [Nanoarchaeota archaeon]|nr:hypothetical protein [Nanoarchaeota archaeon]